MEMFWISSLQSYLPYFSGLKSKVVSRIVLNVTSSRKFLFSGFFKFFISFMFLHTRDLLAD